MSLLFAFAAQLAAACPGVVDARYIVVRPLEETPAKQRTERALAGDTPFYYDRHEIIVDLCGVDLGSAKAETIPEYAALSLSLNESGRKALAHWTEKHPGGVIGVFAANRLLTALQTTPRSDARLVVGCDSHADAEEIAERIQQGGK